MGWVAGVGTTFSGFAAPKHASLSSDGKTWKHSAPGKRSGKLHTYEIVVPAETTWFAWGPTFVLADAKRLVEKTAKASVGAEAYVLCKSQDGHDVPALRWESKGNGKQPSFWIQARQHAWEAGSSWVCQGLVEWLASEEEAAVKLRQSARIHVVPIMDVDNVASGGVGGQPLEQAEGADLGQGASHSSLLTVALQHVDVLQAGGVELGGPGCDIAVADGAGVQQSDLDTLVSELRRKAGHSRGQATGVVWPGEGIRGHARGGRGGGLGGGGCGGKRCNSAQHSRTPHHANSTHHVYRRERLLGKDWLSCALQLTLQHPTLLAVAQAW